MSNISILANPAREVVQVRVACGFRGFGDTATLKEPLFTTSSWVVPESRPPVVRFASRVTVTRLWPLASPVPVKSVRRSSFEKEILISWIPSPLLYPLTADFPAARICLPAYFITKEEVGLSELL